MLGFAIALTRSWTSLYTRGLPADLRGRRRDEIESDLWEHRHQAEAQHDARLGTALQMLLRLLLGLLSDVVWRAETGAAARSGKEPNMKHQPWTVRRVLALIVAFAILPLPPALMKSASAALNPGMKEESNLSVALLGLGANACVLPIALGFMAVFWDGQPGISFAAFAEGSAEIVAGFAALAGLYIARQNVAVGIALIACSALAIAFLAPWTLPAAVVIGVGLTVAAAIRWFAPPPAQTVAA